MTNIGDAFTELVRSTNALHDRFGTAQTVDEALACFDEEVREFRNAAMFNMEWSAGERHVREEAADVIVTLLGVLRAWDITRAELAAALLTVAAKNDAKTHDTHVIRDDGKIARRDA